MPRCCEAVAASLGMHMFLTIETERGAIQLFAEYATTWCPGCKARSLAVYKGWVARMSCTLQACATCRPSTRTSGRWPSRCVHCPTCCGQIQGMGVSYPAA